MDFEKSRNESLELYARIRTCKITLHNNCRKYSNCKQHIDKCYFVIVDGLCESVKAITLIIIV